MVFSEHLFGISGTCAVLVLLMLRSFDSKSPVMIRERRPRHNVIKCGAFMSGLKSGLKSVEQIPLPKPTLDHSLHIFLEARNLPSLTIDRPAVQNSA